MPIAIMVKFDDYKGPTFQNKGVIPIIPYCI